MKSPTIRPAKAGDEHVIASVHIKSWQEAYRGLIPQDYLDALPSELESRVKIWTSILANSQWWIAGGWAIDLFLGKQTRKHDDIDVLIRRDDQLEVQKLLADWDLLAADPPGTLKSWPNGEFLGKGLQDIWGRRTSKDPWQIQIILFDTKNEEWIFKRDESIRRNLESISVTSKDGISLLAPEIQLLYKSKSLRAKDQQDFKNALTAMSDDQKTWLKEALNKVYREGHVWLSHL